jgi:hypothetical protein
MIMLYSKRDNMSMRMVNLGLPPERALFKVKSRTYLKVLTMAFSLMDNSELPL